MRNTLSILLSFLAIASQAIFASDFTQDPEFETILQDEPFFNDHARGWHWYQEVPGPVNKKTEQKSKDFSILQQPAVSSQYPATEELKQYQAKLEEAKAAAVMHPTTQNVFDYQQMQYEMTEKSGRFAEVWMQNVYKNPSLDHTLQFPVSQNARHIYLSEKRKQIEEKIRALSQEYGLFFFFKNNCHYCDAFSPVVMSFSEKYNWEVLAISEFGENHPLFKRSVQDNGLAETWGVSTYPSLFAVNPKTGHVIPVAVGMISIQEMEERIISISKDGEIND